MKIWTFFILTLLSIVRILGVFIPKFSAKMKNYSIEPKGVIKS
jgi:hypothetical protein